ncbi:methyl-accepting chemotaxis protein [Roseospira marina]|nr:cache domain-containing protein [Roseospira marina]MBB4313767.1 methyl-accepting chemotaxis protein [Roseospira marina]MBB5086929.1 methyl-accepting chemotaxis protein [Roseospira marina]
MLRLFRRTPIAIRLWSIVLLIVVLALVNLALNVRSYSDQVNAALLGRVRTAVESAHSVLAGYAAQAASGAMTEAEAKAAARQALDSLRYDRDEYVFAIDFSNVVQVQPAAPKLVGQNLAGLTDENGLAFIREMTRVARTDGEGAVRYVWPKLGGDTPVPKVTVVKAVPAWNWYVGSGVYTDDIDAAVNALIWRYGLASLVVVLGLASATALIGRGIARPIRRLTEDMRRLAAGDLDVDVARDQGAEIGAMQTAVDVFKDNSRQIERMRADQADTHRSNEARVRGEMVALTNALDEEVNRIIDQVRDRAEAMRSAARHLSEEVEGTEAGAGAAAGASRDSAANVDAVAAAAEEMAGSIQEISRQVSNASGTARRAVAEAEQTNARVQGLAEAAGRIGDVVELIGDIAKQTNLLALNATIEAARAGESGKGFAVVANEVKTLANQTGRATEEIGTQIGDMQTATQESVDAIARIVAVIGDIDTITTALSAAIEEQSSATAEISHNAQRAAMSTQKASQNIDTVAGAAEASRGHAGDVETTARDLLDRIQQMQEGLQRIIRAGNSRDQQADVLQRVDLRVTLTIDGAGGGARSGVLRGLARSGVATLDPSITGARGQTFTLSLPGLGEISGAFVARTDVATHVRLDLTDAHRASLDQLLSHRMAA